MSQINLPDGTSVSLDDMQKAKANYHANLNKIKSDQLNALKTWYRQESLNTYVDDLKIKVLEAEVTELKAEVAELKRRLTNRSAQ